MDLSSKFYTHCPHDFGRSVPAVLDTESIVQQKKEVMLTLSDIELTQSLQKEKVDHIILHFCSSWIICMETYLQQLSYKDRP